MRIGRGGARTGAGRKRFTVEQLKKTGTYRPSKHGHGQRLTLVAAGAALPAGAAVPAVPAFVFEGVGAHGRDFIEAAWACVEFAPMELYSLRGAARLLDDAMNPALTPNERRLAHGGFEQLRDKLIPKED